jgi:hypothetical protein
MYIYDIDETIRINVDVIAVLIVMYIYDMDETFRLNVDVIAVLIVMRSGVRAPIGSNQQL